MEEDFAPLLLFTAQRKEKIRIEESEVVNPRCSSSKQQKKPACFSSQLQELLCKQEEREEDLLATNKHNYTTG